MALGRDQSNPIRLHDTEVSRRHAEVRPVDDAYRIVDLGSANGTFVNGQPVDQAPLRSGDRLQLGQTVMLFNDGGRQRRANRDLTTRVDMLSQASPDDRSAILRSIPVGEGSRVLQAPDIAGGWLKDRLMNLSVMYRATQAISHVLDTDALLPQILELVFESIGADRGAILLKDDNGQARPQGRPLAGAGRPRRADDDLADDRRPRPRTRAGGDHLRRPRRQAVQPRAVDRRLRHPRGDLRPDPGAARHLGVLYADIRAASGLPGDASKDGQGEGKTPRSRFSQDHLMLMVAIGHQAGLAIENTVFYRDKIQAERLAAVGQTIATLSHHIKNILQGIRGGSYLIDMGLNEKDDAIVRRGWTIVEKNQGKIYNLVMDMLSFSKDREPALEPADLNETVADVVELMQSRAKELGVALDWQPAADLPPVHDRPRRHPSRGPEHRDQRHRRRRRGRGRPGDVIDRLGRRRRRLARITVADNGVGIDEAEIASIFQVFASTKGSRGTGLGLPVSQKIVREHGGRIVVTSQLGQGSQFIIELPLKRGDARSSSGTGENPVVGE